MAMAADEIWVRDGFGIWSGYIKRKTRNEGSERGLSSMYESQRVLD
jgi:hypothetical protein